MDKITSPLKKSDKGPDVTNLQDALLMMLDRKAINPADSRQLLALKTGLASERSEQTYGTATSGIVKKFQQDHNFQPDGIVGSQTAAAMNKLLTEWGVLEQPTEPETPAYKVKGHVKQADGSPFVDGLVRAFDKDLRNEQILGQALTDRYGAYRIEYSGSSFLNQDRGTADLVVKAIDADESVLVSSAILFNAPLNSSIDITIPIERKIPPSLFERIGDAISPLLGRVKIEELEEDSEHQDLTFLSGETGFDKGDLARFVLSYCLLRHGLDKEFWFTLLDDSFFKYAETQPLKAQLNTILSALPKLDAAAVRKVLTRGLKLNEIAERFRDRMDKWIDAFLVLVGHLVLGDDKAPTFVRLALKHAGIEGVEKQAKFAQLFQQYRAMTPELLTRLEKDSTFKKAEIADLRTSYQLADLTRGDFSVVRMLKDEFKIHRPEDIRTLAKHGTSEWVDLVQRKYKAGEVTLPLELKDPTGTFEVPEAELYAKMLERQFREAFPTAAFAGGIGRALVAGGATGIKNAKELGRIIDRYAEFDLQCTALDEFFDKHINELGEIANDPSFMTEIKAVQRVFKLTSNFEATDALLADGLHSAQLVYRIGESEFVRRYGKSTGFTSKAARKMWKRAADTHAAALTIVGDLASLNPGVLPIAIKNNDSDLEKFPNWNNLFQTGDICNCEDCRSALSPAAYFADLLMFLKDRDSKKPKSSGGFHSTKDILFDRRPDLGFLELNCDNALVPLPYIDVVCEVLEDVVDETDENDLELVGFTAIPPASTAAQKEAVAVAFQKEKIELGGDFSLSQLKPLDPNQWILHGDNVTYLLKKKILSPNFFAKVLRNTKARADELRAYPQYVNPKAYDRVKAVRYPMSLPFDLFAEEVRAGFQKTNLKRWDLMSTMRGAAPPNNPTNSEIAVEYFGISISANPADPSEKNLILVADPTIAGQQEIWGELGNAGWLSPNPTTEAEIKNAVGNVKKLLQKTNLEYNELLALLDLKFINPTGNITIRHFDPSCDTEKKVVLILDAPALDRIHRFLRLWRKLNGWKLWELDRVIRQPGIGNQSTTGEWLLNELFLVELFYFCQLKNKLGGKVSVEQVCALFGNLNTETRFTKLHERREDALYQNLFLNKRLIQPLDTAFQLDPVTDDLPTGQTITAHHPIVFAALGIRESDLVLLKELTKASDSTPYITDALTLANLSFLWRHAWLSKLLKFNIEDWKLVLKIFHQDILQFANPQAAWEFVEHINQLKATGFTPDELNWLLAGDCSAKAATKDTDATRFLAALRKELQAIKVEYDPGQYAFLNAIPPTDVDGLTALLTSLLQKLNRSEAEVSSFIATLRGSVLLESSVQGLPGGFTFPPAIVGAPNHIPIQYDEPNKVLRFIGLMADTQQTTLLNDTSLVTVKDNPDYQNAIADLFQQSQAAVTNYVATKVTSTAGITLPSDRPSIPIRYDVATQTLSFIGVMTTDEQSALKLSNSAAAAAIDELFQLPRLVVKFYEPVFTALLENLPPVVDFNAQLPAELAAKISYDTEQQMLRFAGVMSQAEQTALDALVPNVLPFEVAYHNAVNSLAIQPTNIIPPDDQIWLTDNDLDVTQLANDTYAKRLANATKKALNYLLKTSAENAAVQQSSTQLGLTEAVSRYLLTQYAVAPNLPNPAKTLLAHLTGDFTIDSTTINAWFWANRVAAIWNKWKISLTELKKITALIVGAQLLDLLTLPLDTTGAIAPSDRFIRTSRLIRLRDSLPETEITLLEVLERLNGGGAYTKDNFADDVQLLNETWLKADVKVLTDALNLTYPGDYLLAETWERLRRTFYFIDNLNASADRVKAFAAVAMTPDHAKTLKELLRSRFGAETWLTLSAEIQDVLRERKRDALTAYLLTQPMPSDAPSGKWENTNDLYAYYLLDVEMCSCQLTSRLVQGSGSIQLFVQRCFMGLEPDVVVKANGDDGGGDSAWRWWKWMRKYRVWEANRKVFLWPENWIEPELKKDRSSFFRDLENELLQNEINQDTVEKAFINYLEKLDGVAQLEIAGFYQEDDDDNTIIHVFGRTEGAEPHLYYYRRYDYRQWTPWEKVDLDIQGDYLIPAVVNKRLFLFWPVFTEVPDETENNRPVPIPDSTETEASIKLVMKKLRLQMAVSDYRQGKWTPKRISKDAYESNNYFGEIIKNRYRFYPIDRSDVDGLFGIRFEGHSEPKFPCYEDDTNRATIDGAFEITGCKGVPELSPLSGIFQPVLKPEEDSTGDETAFLKWVELAPHDDLDYPLNNFTLKGNPSTPVLMQTPGIFKMTPPWHVSYLDRLWLDGLKGVWALPFFPSEAFKPTIGNWLPFFYNDKKRTFFVLPSALNDLSFPLPPKNDPGEGEDSSIGGSVRNYYPEIKEFFQQWETYYEGLVQNWVNGLDPTVLTPAQRQKFEQYLYAQFPEISPPPYTNEQARNLFMRFLMRFVHFLLGGWSLFLFQFRQFHFKNFYHPLVCDFAKLVYNPLKGIPSLMSRDTQLKNTGFSFYQTYQPTVWVVEDIPLSFSLVDIKDLTSLASKLKQQQDGVSIYIHDNLSATTLQALIKYLDTGLDADQLQSGLVDDLNKLIENGSIFDAQRFTGISLRPKTQLLLALNPNGDWLIRLNRWLIEDAYPREISRERDAYPKEAVDFSPDGAYSPYNWELFFHAPLLIANSLSKNQRFEEARDWYHFIFNPIGVESQISGGSVMSKYWITKPFFETTDPTYVQQRIENIMHMLASDTTVPGYSDDVRKAVEGQVEDWRKNPFEPHRISNYRTVAYQKTVVMKYLDNLFAWGDYLFRQDSMESINEATQLYILAAEILGPRPKKIPPQVKPPLESFNELETQFDDFSNALMQVENLIPMMPGNGADGDDPAPLPMLYFCIPQNEKMLDYWDTVADRLYKIRHCMNIEGVVRQLTLFEPPIDPGALVKAVAGGMDIGAALADLNAPLPFYRFNILLQKANEVCNDVKALGSALLSALEKKDAEELSQLRQGQEISMLEAVKTVREKQKEEAKENLSGLIGNKETVSIRRDFYRDIEKIIAGEQLSLDEQGVAQRHQTAAQNINIAASVLGYLPNVTIGASGFGGSPHVNVQWGTGNIISALQAASGSEQLMSSLASHRATRASTFAGYDRRFSDWKLQESLANKELDQLDKSIAAAEVRLKIAEKELENQLLQIENAKATDEYMRSKYTNKELYQWQVGQISGVYFQSYKLAFDLAKRAERCFRFELGLQDSNYINFGYWDSLKKGLLSGEKLQYDLRRLETAYFDQHRREFELTKHISLTLLDPLALVKLRETGRCFFNLPEEIFDLDFPGHYFRRIKSVSLTLPCVVGPYTTVSCTLRLLKNSIRINTKDGDNGYPHNSDEQGFTSDDRFIDNNIPTKAIATSSAQNDSGVFELSFRDERYLPFEGAGAISEWSLELFSDLPSNNPDQERPDFGKPLRQFDYNTISEVVLHVKYTAREDAGVFKNGAVAHLREYFSEEGTTHSLLALDLRRNFGTAWSRFLNPTRPVEGNVFEFEMSTTLFQQRDSMKTLKVNTIILFAQCTDPGNYDVTLAPPLAEPPPDDSNTIVLAKSSAYGGLHFGQKNVASSGIEIIPTAPAVFWKIKVERPGGGNLIEDPVKKVKEVGDIILILGYEWS